MCLELNHVLFRTNPFNDRDDFAHLSRTTEGVVAPNFAPQVPPAEGGRRPSTADPGRPNGAIIDASSKGSACTGTMERMPWCITVSSCDNMEAIVHRIGRE